MSGIISEIVRPNLIITMDGKGRAHLDGDKDKKGISCYDKNIIDFIIGLFAEILGKAVRINIEREGTIHVIRINSKSCSNYFDRLVKKRPYLDKLKPISWQDTQELEKFLKNFQSFINREKEFLRQSVDKFEESDWDNIPTYWKRQLIKRRVVELNKKALNKLFYFLTDKDLRKLTLSQIQEISTDVLKHFNPEKLDSLLSDIGLISKFSPEQLSIIINHLPRCMLPRLYCVPEIFRRVKVEALSTHIFQSIHINCFPEEKIKQLSSSQINVFFSEYPPGNYCKVLTAEQILSLEPSILRKKAEVSRKEGIKLLFNKHKESLKRLADEQFTNIADAFPLEWIEYLSETHREYFLHQAKFQLEHNNSPFFSWSKHEKDQLPDWVKNQLADIKKISNKSLAFIMEELLCVAINKKYLEEAGFKFLRVKETPTYLVDFCFVSFLEELRMKLMSIDIGFINIKFDVSLSAHVFYTNFKRILRHLARWRDESLFIAEICRIITDKDFIEIAKPLEERSNPWESSS